jgi:hypothetical protein
VVVTTSDAAQDRDCPGNRGHGLGAGEFVAAVSAQQAERLLWIVRERQALILQAQEVYTTWWTSSGGFVFAFDPSVHLAPVLPATAPADHFNVRLLVDRVQLLLTHPEDLPEPTH